MSMGLIVTEKTMSAQTWVNTHAFHIPQTVESVVPSDTDLSSIGCGVPITVANTAAAAPTNLLQAIVSFEKYLYPPDVSLTKVYVTDGKRNLTTSPDAYYNQTIAIPGVSVQGTGEAILPGSITLIVNRVPSGFSARPGRMFLRGVLMDAMVKLGGPKLVDWASNTQRDSMLALVQTAVTNSKLNTYFVGGTGAGIVMYAIPHYVSWPKNTPKPTNLGELIGVTNVASIIGVGPATRQAIRGRKRRSISLV